MIFFTFFQRFMKARNQEDRIVNEMEYPKQGFDITEVPTIRIIDFNSATLQLQTYGRTACTIHYRPPETCLSELPCREVELNVFLWIGNLLGTTPEVFGCVRMRML